MLKRVVSSRLKQPKFSESDSRDKSPKMSKSQSKAREAYEAHLNDLFQTKERCFVGGYHLGETIGKGTYGEVKLGVHLLTKQRVAVKVMNKIYAPLALKEIQTWRHLRHPNIAQLYEVLTTESHIYLVMEYASRGEVFDYIVSKGRMKEKQARKIFSELVNAVQYCHKKNFVHRDLKPENLLLDANDNLKLIDFGFTTKFEGNRLLDTHCGSVSYVAPEIVKKEKYSGPESDIWSLGVILFALLCGRLPFDDESGNDVAIFEKIISLDYKIDDTCSPDAQDLIQQILKINPKERLTPQEILSHPWLASEDSEIPEAIRENGNVIEGFDEVGSGPLDQEILSGLKLLGFDHAHAQSSLQYYQPDQFSSLFFLLKKSKTAPAEPAPNDLYHPRAQAPSSQFNKVEVGKAYQKPWKLSTIASPSRRSGEERRTRKPSITGGDLFGIREEITEEDEVVARVSSTHLAEPLTPPVPTSPRGHSSPDLKEALSSSFDQSYLKSVERGRMPQTAQAVKNRIINFFAPKADGEREVRVRSQTSLDSISKLTETPDKPQARQVKQGHFDTHNTSTKSPTELIKEVSRVLALHPVDFQRKDFVFIVQGDQSKVSVATSSGSRRSSEIFSRRSSHDDEGNSPPRVIENYLSDASDSSDGGARDSLDSNNDEMDVVGPKQLLRFQLEICQLGSKLHGLRFKRLAGDLWVYKNFCDLLLTEVRL